MTTRLRQLEKWFAERVEYKNLRKKYEKEGDPAKAEYFDRLQLVTKILLNSFYGVLGLKTFRFHDLDNAGAITATGQSVIKFSAKVINGSENSNSDIFFITYPKQCILF